MLNKLIYRRNLILLIFAIVLVVFWLIYLIFGSGEDKVTFLILTPILPIITYGFMRIGFKTMNVNGSNKYINFCLNFFLVTGTLGLAMMTINFIAEFPNGLTPTLGGCMGLIIAVLDEASKRYW